MPAFAINSLVDRLLKREFDAHRSAGTPHPIMLANRLAAVPFADPRMDDWRMIARGVVHLHEPTGLLITGAIDEDWQQSYKRQMEVYQWLLRRQNLRAEVSDTGFFVYYNGQDAKGFDGCVTFAPKLIPYTGSDEWVEPTLHDLKQCLLAESAPAAPIDCEFCGYVEARMQ